MAINTEDDNTDDIAILTVANMVSTGLNRYLAPGDNVNSLGMLYLLSSLALLNLAKDIENNDQLLTTARRFASQGLSRASRSR